MQNTSKIRKITSTLGIYFAYQGKMYHKMHTKPKALMNIILVQIAA